MNHDIPVPFLLFDFRDEQDEPSRLIFRNPIQVISAHQLAEIYPALAEVERAVSQGYYAAGYLSYEAAPAFEQAFTVSPNHSLPLLWFGIFSNPEIMLNCQFDDKYTVSEWQSTIQPAEYHQNIQKIKRAISAGDTYQVNYTMRLRSRFEGDDLGYYHRLRHAQRANYSAYLNIGRFRILSFSPELFFRRNEQRIVTRPMKGTVKRGRWPEEDEANQLWLRSSEKNCAENLMIVDLLRNDLGRIANIGSVNVPELFEIETYPTVTQMTSTVTATVRKEVTLTELLQALFPCGSITGAPKINTMKIIAALETEPREVYCGTIGFVKPNGNAVFNVAIRSIFLDEQTSVAECSVGGGITWDSIADDEYAEALTKAEFLRQASPEFELLETLKLDCGQYVLLSRHLERLQKSAQYFQIPIQIKTVVETLEVHASSYSNESRRVRLLVAETGKVRVESFPLPTLSPESLPVKLAKTPIFSDNQFLYHKTTNRSMYALHRADHQAVFDVLLWNEHREITEFTTGNVVLELDDLKWTPSFASGLLPGTLRAQLLAEGAIHEKILTHADVQKATSLWLINSVRGWVPVHLVQ